MAAEAYFKVPGVLFGNDGWKSSYGDQFSFLTKKDTYRSAYQRENSPSISTVVISSEKANRSRIFNTSNEIAQVISYTACQKLFRDTREPDLLGAIPDSALAYYISDFQYPLKRTIQVIRENSLIGRLPHELSELVISTGIEISFSSRVPLPVNKIEHALRNEAKEWYWVETKLPDPDPSNLAIIALYPSGAFHSILADGLKIDGERISFSLASELDFLDDESNDVLDNGYVKNFDADVVFFACYLSDE